MIPRFTMRQALSDPLLLGGVLAGDSWNTWRTMLIASLGEALTDAERAIFAKYTDREREPGERVEEAAYIHRASWQQRSRDVRARDLSGRVLRLWSG